MARLKFETAEAFRDGLAHRDGSNFYSIGDAIYSYAMRLAHWEEGKIVYDYPSRTGPKGKGRLYSATTNCHMIALEGIVPRETTENEEA